MNSQNFFCQTDLLADLPNFSPTNVSSFKVAYLNHQAAFLLEIAVGLLFLSDCSADAASFLLWFDLQTLLYQFTRNYFDSLGNISSTDAKTTLLNYICLQWLFDCFVMADKYSMKSKDKII